MRNLVSFGLTLLEVFFERWGLTDRLARVFVDLGIRVTGIGHTTGSPVNFKKKGNQ